MPPELYRATLAPMRTQPIKLFLGSVVVYLLVAVAHGCGSSGPSSHGTGGSSSRASASSGGGATVAGSGGAAGHGGASTASAGGKGGAGGAGGSKGTGGAGGIMNPVPDVEAEESGSRLKARRYVGDDGSKQFKVWYDTTLNTECAFQFMSDGASHCAPTKAWGDAVEIQTPTYYQDAACTQEVYASTNQCPRKYAIRSSSSCSPAPTVRVYPVGAQVTGQLYVNAGGCMPYPSPNMFAYALGPEMPPSAFVAASVVQDL